MERDTERRLKKSTEKRGGICVKFYCPTFTGLPDRIVLLPKGRAGFIEVKQPGKGLSPRQKFVHGMLLRLGFPVFKLDCSEQIEGFLNEIEK